MFAFSASAVHGDVAWALILVNALAGIWATAAHRFGPLRVRQLWWAVIAAQAVTAVQVGLGVAAMAAGASAPDLHVAYGVSAVVAMLIMYAYRFQMRAYLFLIYGLGSLFIMGLGIRELFIAA